MRRVAFLAVILVMALSASAFEFEVSIFPSERSIKLNETAVFELEIEHESPVDEVFELYSNDVTWDLRTEDILQVAAGKKLKTRLLVRPLNLNPGAYNLPVNFKRTGSAEQERIVLYVELSSPFPDDATYLPAVRGIATVDQEVDPRKGMTIKLSLENQNRRILETVDVKVRSNVINKDYTTSLGPLEKKTLTFIAELDPLTPPQKDLLQISVIVPEKEKAYQFDLFPLPYEVVSYGLVVPSVETERAFLKRIETITLTNNGNKPLTHVYRVPAWFGKQWFISASPQPDKEASALVWDVSLEAGGTSQLTVIYNYRPLFAIILVLFVLLVAYYVFRSPIVVRKRAVVISSKDGSINEIKVVIDLVNRGGSVVRHVKVMDLAPRLVDVVTESKGAVLPPSKVVPHEKSGTLLRWDIDVMDPKEHRILMYKMKTKLGVLGGMTLPVTAVKFTIDGNERETVSKKPELQSRSQSF